MSIYITPNITFVQFFTQFIHIYIEKVRGVVCMPVSLTAKCAMLKDRDFCGKPPPNLRQRRGSIGQVVEVQTKKSGLLMGQR